MRQKVETLTEAIGLNDPLPASWTLSPSQTVIVTVLMKRDFVSREVLMQMVYSDRDDPPDDRALDRMISKARDRLAPHGVTIENVYGRGWRIPPECKAQIAA
jgi:DNA-binding response OmpR family regulator